MQDEEPDQPLQVIVRLSIHIEQNFLNPCTLGKTSEFQYIEQYC